MDRKGVFPHIFLTSVQFLEGILRVSQQSCETWQVCKEEILKSWLVINARYPYGMPGDLFLTFSGNINEFYWTVCVEGRD